jgi:23S rRNA (guanosine2251-2'-O)-methyltransferase
VKANRSQILFGIHPVAEAMAAGRRSVEKVFLADRAPARRLDEIVLAAEARKIPVSRIAAEALTALAATDAHQGVCARVGPYPYVSLEEILRAAPMLGSGHFILLLDQVVDPRNLGAAARTALSLGVDAVVVPRDRSAASTPAACKASSGALEYMRVARVTNMANAIALLKKEELWVFGLDADAPQVIYETDLGGPLALVVGGEERGIRPLVKRHCDMLLSIPRQGPVLSLNAAVAGAVAIYEVFRQRQAGCLSGGLR